MATLVYHWPFDGNATDTADSNNGTLVGSPSFVTGQIGQAVSLDGSTQSVSTATNAGVTASTAFSLALWANSNSATSFGLISTAIELSPFDGVWFFWGTGGNHSKPYFAIQVSAGSVEAIQAVSALSLNTTYHLCVTYDGSQSIAGMLLYVNGSAVSISQVSDSGFGAFTDRPWRIGVDNNVTDFFSGWLDDARVYSGALTPTEVMAIYTAGFPVASNAVDNPSSMIYRLQRPGWRWVP